MEGKVYNVSVTLSSGEVINAGQFIVPVSESGSGGGSILIPGPYSWSGSSGNYTMTISLPSSLGSDVVVSDVLIYEGSGTTQERLYARWTKSSTTITIYSNTNSVSVSSVYCITAATN